MTGLLLHAAIIFPSEPKRKYIFRCGRTTEIQEIPRYFLFHLFAAGLLSAWHVYAFFIIFFEECFGS
ncbi:hypothetical protein C4553_00200 [Candidatus Parcubacteria bacterium]|nr:MAG: hypothetical protein C4553_00200 [Candidatus Parcubacteria bacterium]